MRWRRRGAFASKPIRWRDCCAAWRCSFEKGTEELHYVVITEHGARRTEHRVFAPNRERRNILGERALAPCGWLQGKPLLTEYELSLRQDHAGGGRARLAEDPAALRGAGHRRAHGRDRAAPGLCRREHEHARGVARGPLFLSPRILQGRQRARAGRSHPPGRADRAGHPVGNGTDAHSGRSASRPIARPGRTTPNRSTRPAVRSRRRRSCAKSKRSAAHGSTSFRGRGARCWPR